MAVTQAFPQNACVYEIYDPQTLECASGETFLRLAELGWTQAEFAGKSVLDIGMNTGLLSLQAIRLGASQVRACDVQAPLVDFFLSVVRHHRMNIEVIKCGLSALDEQRDASDIVLCMEVLHWTTAQGLPLREALKKLTRLTKDTLYLEFPWSVQEPSIAAQTKLTADAYAADIVLEDLGRYFHEVRVVRFMKYFGYGSRSRRVLVCARKKRKEAAVFMAMNQCDPISYDLGRGRNETLLANSADGAVIIKTLAWESRLNKLSADIFYRLFRELGRAGADTICVLPKKIGDHYFVDLGDGSRAMVFPFISTTLKPMQPRHQTLRLAEVLDIAEQLHKQLSRITRSTLESLVVAGMCPNFGRVRARILRQGKEHNRTLAPVLRQALDIVRTLDAPGSARVDCLIHGDLQQGNIVFNEAAQARVIDLDNMHLATHYCDGLMAVVWHGGQLSDMESLHQRYVARGVRKMNGGDLYTALLLLLTWYFAVSKVLDNFQESGAFANFARGLRALLSLQAEYGDDLTAR